MESKKLPTASPEIAITRATVADTPAVLALLDTAVKWLAAHNRIGQWGTTPFSENPQRAERLREFATTGYGLWLAVINPTTTTGNTDDASFNVTPQTTTNREDEDEEKEETPGIIIGALALGEKMPYIPAVPEPELYVRLLVTDRQWAGRSVGQRLLEHARGVARRDGISLLRVDCYAGGDGKLVQYYESQGFERSEWLESESGWPCQVLAQRLDGGGRD
ncbi:hypothetical protein BJX99DRAFT_7145 [Aspergillus californicus]